MGNIGRNIMSAPGVASLDFTLMKETALAFISESTNLQFRWEMYNLFNRPNFGSPGLSLYGRNGLPRGGAGEITGTRSNARQMQLALKFIF